MPRTVDKHFPSISPSSAGSAERAPRQALSLECEARQGLQPWLRVRLQDLSERGFRVTWPAPQFNPRQPIRLRIPGMAMLSADVRWHVAENRTTIVGAEFSTAMHIAVLEHIVDRARQQH